MSLRLDWVRVRVRILRMIRWIIERLIGIRIWIRNNRIRIVAIMMMLLVRRIKGWVQIQRRFGLRLRLRLQVNPRIVMRWVLDVREFELL